ncbi:hypothetical protein CH291_18855 [Rhodococcus sp. 14-1411-2a]|nr:hypothetical protein CH291_18855 [Rhodococcus sp. 14-1411-2a]
MVMTLAAELNLLAIERILHIRRYSSEMLACSIHKPDARIREQPYLYSRPMTSSRKNVHH